LISSNGREYRGSCSGTVVAYYNGWINDMECGDKLRLHVDLVAFIYDIVLENFVVHIHNTSPNI
jgi:hypothetical protein